MEISCLLRKSGLDLVTTKPTSKRRLDYIKDSRKTSSEGRRSSEIGHMSKIPNGSTEWREGSTVCIEWIIWSTAGTESQEHRGFFSIEIEQEGYETT